MGFLQGSHDLRVNGGEFSEVHGDQNHYHSAESLKMRGQNNSAIIVHGDYHNGPNKGISNQAGGDIHVYGQGDGCEVIIGSGFPSRSSQSVPGPIYHATLPQRSNSGNISIHTQPYLLPSHGIHPHFQGHHSGYWNTTQHTSPLRFQHAATLRREMHPHTSPYARDYTSSPVRNCPPFLQQGHTPDMFLPCPMHESAENLIGIQQVPSSFPSGNYVGDVVPPDMMVRNAGISYRPETHPKDHLIPSPVLEPVTRRSFAQQIPAPILMPVPESLPASTAWQNVSTTGIPTFPVALALTQNSKGSFSQMHIPQTHTPEPVLDGTPLSLHTSPTDVQLFSLLPPNRSSTMNTESTGRTLVFNTDDIPPKNEVSNQQEPVISEAPVKTETTSSGITPNSGPPKPKRKRCMFLSWIIKRV